MRSPLSAHTSLAGRQACPECETVWVDDPSAQVPILGYTACGQSANIARQRRSRTAVIAWPPRALGRPRAGDYRNGPEGLKPGHRAENRPRRDRFIHHPVS